MNATLVPEATVLRASPFRLLAGFRLAYSAASFTRAMLKSAPTDTLDGRLDIVYAFLTGIRFPGAEGSYALTVRTTHAAWLAGLQFERSDLLNDGELVVYATLRAPLRLTATPFTPMFEIFCRDGIEGEFPAAPSQAPPAPKEPKVVKVVVPRGASRPSMAGHERSDEEKARLFMEESDDVPARITPAAGDGPILPAAAGTRARELPGDH